ncbi:MAG: hypothetical protein SGARI_006411, partial [Bacillariaceae sp.]
MAATTTQSGRQPQRVPDIGDEPEEPFDEKVKRMATNCGHETGLCCFKAQKQTQISALELQVSQRKKKFGVDYLSLVKENAGQQKLKECLKEAQSDLAKLQGQIDEHLDNIDGKEQQVNEKIVPASNGSVRDSRKSNNASIAKPQRESKMTDLDVLENDAPRPTKSKTKAKKPSAKSKTKKKNDPKKGAAVAGIAAAEIPEDFQDADPSRWKLVEKQFSGQTTYVTRGKQEVIKGQSISIG